MSKAWDGNKNTPWIERMGSIAAHEEMQTKSGSDTGAILISGTVA